MSCRTVVVLQGEQAFWFRWQGDELVDSFVESVRTDSLTSGIRHPWINTEDSTNRQLIEMVLDTNTDELDKVKLDIPTGRRVGIVRLWHLQRSLKLDYPTADVYRLPAYMGLDVLSIHHPLIPDMWCRWLQRLQSCHAFITHVVTAAELMARCDTAENGPVLYRMELPGENRHLLVDQGVPLFMRIVKNEPTNDGSELLQVSSGLQQTLEHVSETVLGEAWVVTVLTPSTERLESTKEVHAAYVLSALCINRPVEFTMQRWAQGSLSTDNESCIKVRLPVAGQNIRRMLRKWFERLPWPLPQVRSDSLNPLFRIARKQRLAPHVFKPSVDDCLLRQRINALRDATVLSAAMATVTVCLATLHGLDSVRMRLALSDQQAVLAEKILTLDQAVKALHPSPEYVLSSMQRIEEHEHARPLDPQHLLATLADAVTAFPPLILETLSWSVISADDNSASMAEVAINMPGREYLWGDDVGRAQVQIELSGTVVSDSGLRDQHKALQSFVAYLEAVPGISTVHVLESPAEAARSSAVLVDAGSRYRLSLVLSAS